jgi:transposase-like protein
MASGKETTVRRVAGRQRWGVEDGRAVVESWRQSGEALAEFARRHGLKPQRLSRWARRIEAADEAVRFHPVRLVPREEEEEERQRVEPIEIVLGDGRLVRVPAGFAAGDLARVLSVLAVGV